MALTPFTHEFPSPDPHPHQDTVDSGAIDAAWRHAVMESIRDGLFLFDSNGLIIDMNQAFVDLFGYAVSDGPFYPPYPWWPTKSEDAEGLRELERFLQDIKKGVAPEREFRFFTRDRTPVWVESTGTSIEHGALGTTYLRILRDITRQREAQRRRAAAVNVSHAFAHVDDLGDLIGIAEHGFGLLFDGQCTIQIGEFEARRWFSAMGTHTQESLAPAVQVGLAGAPNPDTTSLRPGILLVPSSPGVNARAWVQFPRPRRISVDEMVAADLLASYFAAAISRVSLQQEATERISNLRTAVESHRLIGQATGVLVERYRILPSEAFDRLRAASQRRNIKVRELAALVMESGEDPDIV